MDTTMLILLVLSLAVILLIGWKNYNEIQIIKQYQQEKKDTQNYKGYCSPLADVCETDIYPWWRYSTLNYPRWGLGSRYYNPILGWYSW